MGGTYFEEDFVATGMGSHMAIPLLRNACDPNQKKRLPTKAEAEALIIKCLQVCFYRDCNAYNKYTLGICDGKSVQISDPIALDHFWEHEAWMEKRLTVSTG